MQRLRPLFFLDRSWQVHVDRAPKPHMRQALRRSCGGVLRARAPASEGPTQNLRVDEDDVLFEGDTVRLVFGGPLMTVLAVTADRCCCFWFDDQGRLAHGEFERDVVAFVAPAKRLIPHTEAFWRKRRPVSFPASNSVRNRASSSGATRSALQ